jgi:hypothetical protein
MKTTRKYSLFSLPALAFLLVASSGALAQTTTTTTANNPNYNHPPCDFNDAFYQGIPGDPLHPGNGIVVAKLNSAQGQRFGTEAGQFGRQFGPPASGTQANWVVDPTCSTNDPDRTNIRILATTAGYRDDVGLSGVAGSPTEFISLIAFLTDQTFFTGVANKRNIQMIDIASNFEGYVAPKQRLPDGTFAKQPCGSLATIKGAPCFPVTSVATPQLRQDWRFSTNRNAIDGSDNNNPLAKKGASNSPFGYFCDDTLGMWILTYFWYTVDPANPGPACGPVLAKMAALNGTTLDGTPIIKTGDQLHQVEGVNNPGDPVCALEGNLAVNGADGGPVWAICPAIMDPRNGAIAPDAFLDQVKTVTGAPLDPAFNANFNCLQQKGNFPDSNGICNPDNTGL